MPDCHALAVRHLPADTWRALRRPPIDAIRAEAGAWPGSRQITMSWVSAELEDQARQRLARAWGGYIHARSVATAYTARLRVAALIAEIRGYQAQARACRVSYDPAQ